MRPVKATKKGSGAPITAKDSMDMDPGSSELVLDPVGKHTLIIYH